MHDKVYDFRDSLEYGKSGEERIISFLLSADNVEGIEDVRDNRAYQGEDIDVIVTDKALDKHSCEIKTDSYTSGNLFYETISCIETGSLGCMEKTGAEYILYYFENYGELYVLKTKELREFFNKYKAKFRRVTVKNKRDFGCGTYTTEGYLIPKHFIRTHFHAGTVVNIPMDRRCAG